jgi:hypothetical protein
LHWAAVTQMLHQVPNRPVMLQVVSKKIWLFRASQVSCCNKNGAMQSASEAGIRA